MKYLKRFNEELSPNVYNSAASKLRQMGHTKRSDRLENHARTSGENIKWRDNIDNYSKYGKIRMKFNSLIHDKKTKVSTDKIWDISITKNVSKKQFEGDFYFAINFDDCAAQDNILFSKREGSVFEFSIPFSLGLIPVDEETKNLCDEGMPDPDFYNGFYWALWINVCYKVEDEKATFDGITYTSSQCGDPVIADRRSAILLKKSLMDCFNEHESYPTGNIKFPITYDLLFTTLCQELELQPEYNLSMEKMLSDISSFSVNKLYKD